MKKLFTSLAAGFLLIMSNAFSQNLTFSISPTPITKDAGESFSVDVVVNNFTNVASAQFSINWNQNLIRFDSVGLGNAQLAHFDLGSVSTLPVLVNVGQMLLAWFDEDAVKGKNLPNGTVLFKIYYTAVGGPSSNILFTGQPAVVEFRDGSDNLLEYNFNNGVVNVNGGPNSGPGVGPVVFSSESVDVNEGDHFCIDVTVENFSMMEAAQFTMEWDTAIVSFDSVANLNLPYLAVDDFASPPNSTGILNFTWTNDANNLPGVSVANGTAIFQLCFTAKKTGFTDVSFTGSSTNIAISRVGTNGQNEGLINNAGTIAVFGGTITDFYQWAPRINAASGSTVCLPVRVLNFDDIVLFQYSVHFDPAILTFDTVRFDSTLIGMSLGDFGLNEAADGTITVRWFDDDVSGVNLPDSTILYELCFIVNGSNGQSSDITFNGNPTVVEAGKRDGSSEIPIPLLLGRGKVTVGTTGPPPTPPLRLRASSPSVDQGETVCVDITAQNFTKITELDYSMTWNPAVLQYQSVQQFDLTGLTSANFTPNQNAGTLALSWDAPGGTGITKSNNARLYQVCFTASGQAGTSSDIDFGSTPTPVFIKNETGDTLVLEKTKGKVSINTPVQNCGTVPGFAIYAEHITVPPGDTGCVKIMVQQFANIASFQWSMAYDAAKLKFVGSQGYNLPGLDASTILNPFPGEININWEAPNFAQVSRPDCAVIFELCFEAIGAINIRDTIKFVDAPVPPEFTDGNVVLPLPTFVNGSVLIKQNTTTPDIALTGMVKRVECKGGSTGAITLNVSGGTGTFNYNWSPGNVTTKDLIGIPAGVYTVTITSGTKTKTETFTVGEPTTALALAMDSKADVKCFGDNIGAITLAANGGWGMYTVRWNPSTLPTTLSVTGLAAGDYSATITDDGGCQVSIGPITVAGPSRSLAVTSSVIRDVDCAGRNNGSISITPIGGTPLTGGVYNFNWSPAPPANPTSKDQSNLSPGTYFVTITDANQCTFSRSYTVATVSPIDVTQVVTDANGAPNGAINITVNGGTPINPPPGQGYTYSWRGPGTPAFTSASEDISNLFPGTYMLTVTDAVNCTVSFSYVVGGNVDPPLEFDNILTTKTCPGASTGSIRVFVRGGQTPITYSWSGPGVAGRTSSELFNLAEGAYTVTVRDGRGMQISQNINVEAHPIVTITASSIEPERGNPGTNNGSITLNVTGGVGPFTYRWNPGNFNTKDISGLGAGNYTVTVTDQGSTCQYTATFTVGFEGPVSVSVLKSDISCPGGNDGQFTLTITGKPNYTITVNGNAPIVTSNSTYTQTGLSAGNYTVTIVDGNNTSTTLPVIVINSPAPFADVATVRPRTTNLLGQINLTVTGGTGTYTYVWSNGATSEDLFNLSEGCYRATVTDSKGCSFVTKEYCITLFQIISVDVDSVKCANERNGRIAINADGGNEPYTYEWRQEGGANIIDRDSVLDNQPAGRYIVRIIGSAGTVLEATYVIGSQSNITANAIPVTNFGGYNVSCFDVANGRATVSATGGKAPYGFNWDNGQTGPQATNLSGGIYEVTVTDALGCQITTQVELRSPEALESNASVEDVSCSDKKDGRIQLTVTGGVPKVGTPKYDYEWDQPGLSGATVQFLAAGTYNVTITDANGCQKTESFTVERPANALSVQVITTEDDGTSNGTAIAIISGGTDPYFLKWNTEGADSTEFEIRNLTTGLYAVRVTDANGCTATGMGEVKDRRIECLSARTVITPDGDGLNEEFIIYCLEDYIENRLEIYNRWGQLVFDTDNYDNTWAGTSHRGAALPEGAYFFVFQYRDRNNKLQQLKGSFTLLRE